MRRSGWGRWVIALFTLLLLSAITLLFGREDSGSNPTVTNTKPSGLGALAELLKADGFTVVSDRNEVPKVTTSDLVIAPIVLHESFLTAVQDKPSRTKATLEKLVEDGGTVLLATFPEDFSQVAGTVQNVSVEHWLSTGQVLTVSVGGPVKPDLGLMPEITPYTFADREGVDVKRIKSNGLGAVYEFDSGVALTNRYLADVDNAEFIVGLARRTVRPEGRVVFIQALTGDFDRSGLLGELGTWAVVTQWQVLFVLLIVGLTSGARFGPLLPARAGQRSARHLIDSFSELLRRSGKQQFAAAVVMDFLIKKSRAKLRIPPSMSNDQFLANAGILELYRQIQDETSRLSATQVVSMLRGFMGRLENSVREATRR